MSSLFTQIVEGKIPCHKVMEDEKHLAFLEIRPLSPGHTLVIPKKETDYVFDLSDKELAELFIFSKKVAEAIRKAIPCEKVALIVYGLQVRHAHVHLIPVKGMAGELDFSNAKTANNADLQLVANKILAYSLFLFVWCYDTLTLNQCLNL